MAAMVHPPARRHAMSPVKALPPPAAPAAQAPPAKEKVVPPSPPMLIKDKERGSRYTRIGFLGEGGFARVYEVQDSKARRRAVKVVNKANVRSKKNKTKLWAEIKLHQMLKHPHVVQFEDCFEDEENVYMILELCEHGSLMDLLRRRKRYTEPEARYYLVQLIAACQYMHQMNVIHRDLKLGNLFLDANMDIKVGDFGLAALIEKPGDRKKTICGTPNYIAPEVLFDTANGHSFEVDIWSVGVILYTLLIGKPPFQTKDIKAIYKRIRENRYEFPPDREISDSAKNLIETMLNPNPDKRPSFGTILTHRWFRDGPFPQSIPTSANDFAPVFPGLDLKQSIHNFEFVCRRSGIGAAASIKLPDEAKLRSTLVPNMLQQERDFKMAVQPDSPISALLNSARQPLVQGPATIKDPGLLRKLTAAGAQSTLSPVRRRAGKENFGPQPSAVQPLEKVGEEEEVEELQPAEALQPRYDQAVRDRQLASQKARIVSQMADKARVPVGQAAPSPRRPDYQRAGSSGGGMSEVERRIRDMPGPSSEMVNRGGAEGWEGLFDRIDRTLSYAFQAARTTGYQARVYDPEPVAPRVFVMSWLDYCNKYGMGFAMTDGTVSVHFNDSTSLSLAPNKSSFDHIDSVSTGGMRTARRANYQIDAYPSELRNKVYLLHHFENYMMDKLFGEQPYTFRDMELTKGMVFVTRYLRMKHVIVFRLSNDVLQFNFLDHTKLIISNGGETVSFIDKHYVLRTWSLEQLLAPLGAEMGEKDKKRIESVIHKTSYVQNVLSKINSHEIVPKAPVAGAVAGRPIR